MILRRALGMLWCPILALLRRIWCALMARKLTLWVGRSSHAALALLLCLLHTLHHLLLLLLLMLLLLMLLLMMLMLVLMLLMLLLMLVLLLLLVVMLLVLLLLLRSHARGVHWKSTHGTGHHVVRVELPLRSRSSRHVLSIRRTCIRRLKSHYIACQWLHAQQ